MKRIAYSEVSISYAIEHKSGTTVYYWHPEIIEFREFDEAVAFLREKLGEDNVFLGYQSGSLE